MYFLYLSLYTYPILYALLMPIHDILPYIAPPWLASLVLPSVVVDDVLFGHFYISRCSYTAIRD
ncbi:hypothetical protein B0H14DRAFT_2941089 [Mycena olivaceomarginata]|nr:hypothetical protein B0H14DRAFT_2941089 [Mycena olivaceomarginata]